MNMTTRDAFLKVMDGAGNETVYHYDESRENVASSYKPVQIDYPTFTRKITYDSLQRIVRETDILDGNTTHSASYTYDAGGNIISKTDEEGNTSFFEYDALNRLVKIIDPMGGVTRISYDNRGNVLSTEDPKGGITTNRYDRNSRLIKMTRPMGEATSYGYDALGNRTAVLDSKGQKISYEYDDRNRLVRAYYYAAEDPFNPVKTVNFSYDNLGKLLSYDDGTTSAAYTYDDLGRKTQEAVNYGPFGLSYSYGYYANGAKKSFTGPDGSTDRIRLRCK